MIIDTVCVNIIKILTQYVFNDKYILKFHNT